MWKAKWNFLAAVAFFFGWENFCVNKWKSRKKSLIDEPGKEASEFVILFACCRFLHSEKKMWKWEDIKCQVLLNDSFLPPPHKTISSCLSPTESDKNLKLNFMFFFAYNYISAWLKIDVRRVEFVESIWKNIKKCCFVVLFRLKWSIYGMRKKDSNINDVCLLN